MAVVTLVLFHVLWGDLSEVSRGEFGNWLSPGHRQVFRRLRQSGCVDRTLIVLDPQSLDVSKYPWDAAGLKLAAPEKVVAIPAERVTIASSVPWNSEDELSPVEQQDVLQRPHELAHWARKVGFGCVIVEKLELFPGMEQALGSYDYEFADSETHASTVGRLRSSLCP